MSNKIVFFIPPDAFKSGNDIINEIFLKEANNSGLKVVITTLWPNWLAKRYYTSILPRKVEFRLFKVILYRMIMDYHAKRINCGDIAWIWPNAAITDNTGYLENKIVERGGKVIFHFMDDWFSIKLGSKIINRSKFVSYYVVPTEELRTRVKSFLPLSKVKVLEEPIDVARINIIEKTYNVLPNIVWTGSAHNFRKIHSRIEKIIDSVNISLPVNFVLISGSEAPRDFNPEFSWEWHPYNYELENSHLSRCDIGLSIFESESIYEKCKGNYKIKTYLAAGIPAVASNFGYNKFLIQDGYNGYLIDDVDDSFSTKIIELLSNKNLLMKLSQNARQSALKNFSYEAVLIQWRNFISSI